MARECQLIATKKKPFCPGASWTFDHTDLFHRVHGTSNFMEEIEHEESCSKKWTCYCKILHHCIFCNSSGCFHQVIGIIPSISSRFLGELPEDATPPKRRGCCSKPPAGVTSNNVKGRERCSDPQLISPFWSWSYFFCVNFFWVVVFVVWFGMCYVSSHSFSRQGQKQLLMNSSSWWIASTGRKRNWSPPERFWNSDFWNS